MNVPNLPLIAFFVILVIAILFYIFKPTWVKNAEGDVEFFKVALLSFVLGSFIMLLVKGIVEYRVLSAVDKVVGKVGEVAKGGEKIVQRALAAARMNY